MPKFTKKNIDFIETLGEKLKSHRLNYGASLQDASRLLQINYRYLKYLENDDYENLPADIYTKKFLGRYAQLLNLNPEIVINQFEKEKKIYYRLKKDHHIKNTDKKTVLVKALNFVINPQTLKILILLFVISIIIIYLGHSINKIFLPPELIIKNPYENNVITTKRTIVLSGTTEKEVTLAVNSKQILIDENGNFELALDLQKGLNIIKISAEKKHSKPKIIYRQIILAEESKSNLDD